MSIPKTVIQQAKSVNVPELFRSRNHALLSTNAGSSYKCLCPFHDEKNPSLHITQKNGLWLWHCFGCGKGGSAIDFIMESDSLGFHEAVTTLVPTAATYPQRPQIPAPSNPPSHTKLFTALVQHYHQLLLQSKKGMAYLKKRGLGDEAVVTTFQLGFSDGQTKHAFPKTRHILKDTLGIFNVHYYELFSNCIIMPIFDELGTLTDLYGRRIVTYQDRANHCYNKGNHRGVFNHKNVVNKKTVILTECIIDALSIYISGHTNVTSLFGVQGWSDGLVKLFADEQVQEVVLAFDSDTAGQAGVAKVAERLSDKDVRVVLLPDGIKDINELLVKQGPDRVHEVVAQAVGYEDVRDTFTQTILKEPENDPKISYELEDTDLIYTTDSLSYRVRQATNRKDTPSLRLVITVTNRTNPQQSYTDRIDLYLSRSRNLFAHAVSRECGVQPAVVNTDLVRISKCIEDYYQQENASSEQSSGSRTREMSDAERQEATALLESPDLIKTILRDITALGYVGEDENKLLLYLCATSRKLSKPLSVLIGSQSSSGKSFLIDKICALLPDEDVHKWTSLTPKALYYLPEDALVHTFLAIDERIGAEEAEYPIRSLQSGGRLSLAVPVKNPSTGKMVTEQIVKQGPIAYVDGSTNRCVNPENANRCFEIFLDESAEQTERIQHAQRKNHILAGWYEQEQRAALQRTHQNAQRLLQPIKVIVPYIDVLEFPSMWVRTRRDHDRFLSLLVCITFLHQYQREHKTSPVTNKPYIESTLSDYRHAYDLASVVIGSSFQELEKPLQDFYDRLQETLSKKADDQHVAVDEYWFTRRDVRSWLPLPDYMVKRYMRQLTDLEYVMVKAGPQGSRYRYRLTRLTHKQRPLQGLLTPHQLRSKIAKSGTK